MSDGLEDVVAAHTVLSEVDGAAGRLVMRGHSLDELAGHTSFEEMAALMLDGFVPDLPAMKDLAAALGAGAMPGGDHETPELAHAGLGARHREAARETHRVLRPLGFA